MKQRLAALTALVFAVVIVAACDITQSHLDQAADRLAGATVATGTAPTAEQIAAGITLEQSHLAGSSWRLIEVADWPHAMAVVTLGTNGRTIWHTGESHLLKWHHWRVKSGALQFSASANYAAPASLAGRRIDPNTACLTDSDNPCGYVLQRVTP